MQNGNPKAQNSALFCASVLIAAVAMARVSPDALARVVPEGWNELLVGWKLNLDWSGLIEQLNTKIEKDGFSLFGIVIMMMLLKGLLVSMAGPTPGYGMQHVLSTRNPREAALENWWMSIVQLVPRFLMITGIAVLGLVYFSPEVNQMLEAGETFDFEKILPYVIRDFVPIGLVGVLLAGLLAAFMSTFDSTVNAGAAYVVNDIYKRYINPHAPAKRYVHFSYFGCVLPVLVAIFVGLHIKSIHGITTWITFALYGGYIAPNVLKWHWWRFNGYGYFAGMVAGIVAAIIPLLVVPNINKMYILPFSFLLSAVASVVVCLKTPAESDTVLGSFYRDVRPWGFWKPVHDKLTQANPSLRRNTDFTRDAFNVGIGIIRQVTLIVVPICLVIRQYRTLCLSVLVLIVSSAIMKFTWYDKLGPGDMSVRKDE